MKYQKPIRVLRWRLIVLIQKNNVLTISTEPSAVKEQILKSSTETACMILRIDDVVASSKQPAPPPGDMGGMGGGMPPGMGGMPGMM